MKGLNESSLGLGTLRLFLNKSYLSLVSEVLYERCRRFFCIDVDEMLQLRNKKQLFLLFVHAFACVACLGLPSKFVVDNET